MFFCFFLKKSNTNECGTELWSVWRCMDEKWVVWVVSVGYNTTKANFRWLKGWRDHRVLEQPSLSKVAALVRCSESSMRLDSAWLRTCRRPTHSPHRANRMTAARLRSRHTWFLFLTATEFTVTKRLWSVSFCASVLEFHPSRRPPLSLPRRLRLAHNTECDDWWQRRTRCLQSH